MSNYMMKAVFLTTVISSLITLADNVALFDGKTLNGWDGDPKYWSVVGGAIQGKSTKETPCKNTTYLIYKSKEFSNFELSVQFRFMTQEGNSGIQYRSQRPNPKRFQINGYQADLEAGPNYSGILYDQGGRGIAAKRGQIVQFDANGKKKILEANNPEAQKAQESIKIGEWNSYQIIADENKLTHYINGHKTIEVLDDDLKHRDSKGILALQLHAGPAMTIQYKDIDMLELDHKPVQPKIENKPSEAQWIWSEKLISDANQTIHLSKNFTLKQLPKKSMLSFTCDNSAEVSINGALVGKSNDWKTPVHVDVAKYLKQGENKIYVKATNQEGIAGLVLKLSDLLVSDTSWQVADANNQPLKTRSIGKYGTGPWGKVLGDLSNKFIGKHANSFKAMAGFKVDKIYDTNKNEEGSWVAMCFDNKGTLYVGDQFGDIFMLTLNKGKITKKEKLDVPVREIQGLLWAFDSLYISNQTRKDAGIYRVKDSNNDGTLDKTDLIIPLTKGGEHGPHSIVVAPDGKNLLYIQGNFTPPPNTATSISNRNWAKDVLHPHLPDGAGHASHVKQPAGNMFMFSPDGKNTKIMATGMRNMFDIAVSPTGDVFGYDSDMEYDIGTPWYRPTRVNHLIEGADFGWRNGTAKWPDYYADSLGSVLDIGPGSPTGVTFGTGAKFPAKYQKALYINDWTFGRMYAVHLTPDNYGYKGTKESFVWGKPLPLTDVTIGPDGSMYFLTGGRRLSSALYSVKYIGKESTDLVETPAIRMEQNELRYIQQSRNVSELWQAMGSKDRTLRYAARVSLETIPLTQWVEHFDSNNDPQTIITASLAMSRLKGDAKKIHSKLLGIDFTKINEPTKLEYLRAVALACIRTGKPDSETNKVYLKKLDSQYPATNNALNRELCRILVYLESPTVLDKSLFLIKSSITVKEDIPAELLEGHDRYGNQFKQMLSNMPNTQALHYAMMLKNQKQGWTESKVTEYYSWLADAETKTGGNSYKRFIINIRKEAMTNLTPELIKVAQDATKRKTPTPTADVAIAKGPGRAWTIDEALREVADLSKANYDNGKKMFQAVLCSRCHAHTGGGGGSGPDLTNLATRFNKHDILKSIIEPSEVISDQYVTKVFTLKDKNTIQGKIMQDDGTHYYIGTSAFDPSIQTKILKSDITNEAYSPISSMPPSLINALNPDELRDVMKFLTTAPK